ncbi:hypothetical protein BaRGS_00032098 [Batillaria attramentaria]|uniref:SH3 domain-containing protein n=1 Tax=Batillaria attramentaria TaxID=370345 RepID=A0ABD0JPV9_9CAEN
MRHEVGHYVKAVYDFTAQESGELSLRVGDIIRLTDVSDKDWLQGEAIYGGSGIFPANFVEKLVLPDTRMGQRVFVALMDFPAEQNGDLELTKGDIILGLEQVDENWWKGKIGPLRGIFPLSCVQELVVPTEGPRSRSASLRSRSSSIMSHSDSLASQPMPETVFARALVDVVPQIEGELGFQVGDLITVKEIVDDDWFYGECHNKVGLVSTICIEFLDDFGDAPSDDRGTAGREVTHEQSSPHENQRVENTRGDDRSSHTNKNLTLHSVVSYTSENTRSHDVEITPYAKTLYPFQAQLPNELSFNDNEIVTLIQHVDEDWIEGELDGKIGLFPANFVEIIVDCPYAFDSGPVSETLDTGTASLVDKSSQLEEASGQVEDKAEEVNGKDFGREDGAGDATSESITQNGLGSVPSIPLPLSEPSLALVLHNFKGQVEGDLSVKEGDTIEVLRVVDDDWIEARGDGDVVGLVPKNHVEIITGGPQKVCTDPVAKGLNTGTVENNAAVSNESADRARSGDVSTVPHKRHEVNDIHDVNSQTSNQERSQSGEATTIEDQTSHVQSSSSTISSVTDTAAAASTVFSSSASPCLGDNHQSASLPKSASQSGTGNDCKPKPPPEKPKLLPKPKLAPKPAVKAKPMFAPKPFVPKPSSSFGHIASPTEKNSFAEEHANLSDTGKEKKIFTDLNTNLSLDNIVQAELRKAKTEGDRSRGSSFGDDDKRSSTGSFSSSLSDDQPSRNVPPVLQTNDISADLALQNLAKIEELSSKSCLSDADHSHTRSAGSQSLAPPSLPLNRSTSDSGFGISEVTMRTKPHPPAAVNQRHSMPPARPVPPPPSVSSARSESKRLSFVNKAYEHEGEGRLLNLDVSQGSSLPPPPTRPVPRPPPPVISAAPVSSTAQTAQARVKRPPPRPTGPRVASVPSKTPLQPVRLDSSSKPMPHRPAPPAPGPRRPAPVAPGVSGSVTSRIPPRPATISAATTTPPKRPPPRGVPTTKSPSDLMRFSPEPVSESRHRLMPSLVDGTGKGSNVTAQNKDQKCVMSCDVTLTAPLDRQWMSAWFGL